MPQTDWYNHNRYISYPLIAGVTSVFAFSGGDLKESALLDAGFILGIDADYDDQYRVRLTQIVIAGSSVTFRFEDETGSATFDIAGDSGDASGTLQEADATEGPTYGSGWIVTGDLATLVAELGNGTHTPTVDEYYVEPATVQSLNRHYVKQVTIGSQPDIPWHKPAACGGAASDIWIYTLTGRNLTGERKFLPGYNAIIAVVEEDNAIEIGAGVGSGDGEPCARVEVTEDYGSSSLSSTSSQSLLSQVVQPRCKDIFNTINGIRPDALGNFRLVALSPGIKITPYPNLYKIVVSFGTGANTPFCNPGG